ncbi:MAG: mandelate racemase/muconate lactonizing enzyme family protein [Chloroflexi bacterium]|nr:mandelate racemase/muconate lactonizing enzyme family protein [Chloroflexota bacterium]
MQITEIRSRAVSVPLEIPIRSAIRVSDRVDIVVIDVLTDTEIVGQTYIQAFGPHQARAVRALVAYLGDALRGENPILSLRCWQVMDRAINLLGRGGIATFALSGIDCAIWDIVGKASQSPVAMLLGAAGDRCAAYQSAGLWLEDPTTPILSEQAQAFVEQGFHGVKMRVGRADPEADMLAAQVVREAIGPQIMLMMDANQGWSTPRAIGVGRSLQQFEPLWIEEPVDHDDFAGHAEVARALTAPIATGENVYMPRGFKQLIDAGACDIVMPDVQRVGGVTGWMRVAAMAEAARLPIASHLFPEISVHLLAASPTTHILEYMPWAQPILAEKLVVQNGAVFVPALPGLGLVFDEAAIERFAYD